MRHGEYKMPGGKLTVVDLDVIDGRLSHVAISGDFFLEPDSTLDVINAALTGLPADSNESLFAAAVADSLPHGATLYGVSPEVIATAVSRAIAAGDPA